MKLVLYILILSIHIMSYMDVEGSAENVLAFRFVCSSSFQLVENRFTSQGIELSFDMLLEIGDKLFPIRFQ